MRDGVPLPGSSPAELLSQLAHRVFGPLRLNRVRAMLDFHGLADRPAQTAVVVAARHDISNATVTNWARTLRTAGVRLPLSPDLATEICRQSTPGEDHLGRTRVARTLGFPPPKRPTRPDQTLRIEPAQVDRSAAGIAIRVLATVGPQTLGVLQDTISRDRRSRPKPAPTDHALADALHTLGAVVDDGGRWHAPSGSIVPSRYQALVAQVGGRTLTRGAMITALVDAGYTHSYAETRAINTHPMIRRIGPNAYLLIGDHHSSST